MSLRWKVRRSISGYIFILPSLLFVGCLLLVPIAQNIYYSLFNWDGLAVPRYIGLKNYITIFKDAAILSSLFNTTTWVVFTVVFPVSSALVLAFFLNSTKHSNIYKTVFYFPLVISVVSVSIIWQYIYSYRVGAISSLLNDVLRLKIPVKILTEPYINTIAMMIAFSWQAMGGFMVLFLMGLSNMPTSPIESATIDGASKLQTLIYIVIPMLSPVITIVVGTAIVNSFKVFDIIYVMTKGGPFRSSETLAVTMIRETFTMFRFGYGASIATLLSVLVIIVTAFYVRNVGKTTQYQEK